MIGSSKGLNEVRNQYAAIRIIKRNSYTEARIDSLMIDL